MPEPYNHRQKNVDSFLKNLKQLEDEESALNKHVDLFYTLVRTNPHYALDDVKDLEVWFRDKVHTERYWLNESRDDMKNRIMDELKE